MNLTTQYTAAMWLGPANRRRCALARTRAPQTFYKTYQASVQGKKKKETSLSS